MLTDEIEVTLKAGDGGEGKISFGKFEKSGPDGGNGGKGGDLYLLISSDLTLLAQFHSKKELSAENGIPGGKNKLTGRTGKDLEVKIPVGSLLTDVVTGEKFEFEKVGERVLFLKGGQGGIGNWELRSSTNTTPKQTIPPEKGEERKLKIILRFIADYGLIGLPSAGKSSLLNELTNTKVKTAQYHFTTLSPNLGILPNKKILADIPGLIEGASKGKGLGAKFLKHVEKVDLLLHCISAESNAPLEDYKTVRKELEEFNKNLLSKKEIILVTKSDILTEIKLSKLIKKLSNNKRKIITTSIYDPESIDLLLRLL